MARKDDIEKLIAKHNRRLQILKEERATKGANTPPETLTEIEDIASEIKNLQAELDTLRGVTNQEATASLPRLSSPILTGESSPMNYKFVVGIILLAAVFFIFGAVLGNWLAQDNVFGSTPTFPPTADLGATVQAAVASTFAAQQVNNTVPISAPTPPVQDFPFEVKRCYDFETTDTVKPWRSTPDEKQYHLEISDKFARSGKFSLRLLARHTEKYEHAGIINYDFDLSKVKTVVAWVFIPESEPVGNTDFKIHIIGINRNNGNFVGFYGQEERIEPGKWTPVLLGTFDNVAGDTIDDLEWGGRIDDLHLSAWSDEHYDGSIYFDDITVY
jgi:hypothetical protein